MVKKKKSITTDIGSRKARRKEERQAKRKRRREVNAIDEPTKKPKSTEETAEPVKPLPVKPKEKRKEKPQDNNKVDKYVALNDDIATALRRDDEEIAELEAKLGIGNKKEKSRLNKEYAKLEGYGDDFGDFLDDLDDLVKGTTKRSYEKDESDDGRDFSDSEPDEEEVLMNDAPMMEEDDSIAHQQSDDDEDDDDGDDEQSYDRKDNEPYHNRGRNNNHDNGTEESGDDKNSNDEGSDSQENGDTEEPDHDVHDTYGPSTGEDIYGQNLDASKSNISQSSYVPPHLRKRAEEDNTNRKEQLLLLKRAVNSSLNRLSEDTLISVSQTVAKLYPSYSTSDVNASLWDNLFRVAVERPMLMTSMIPVYVACFSGVHVQKGDLVQLGGYMIEEVMRKLWTKAKDERERDDLGEEGVSKETCNLMLVMCYLYNFGLVHCSFIYDVVKSFIKDFTELDIELLLLILSHCGHALRSDDPSAMKEIVLSVQRRNAENKTNTNSSRVEYMISAMIDLKNNKRRKQDLVFGEKTAKLRKLIGRIKSTAASTGSSKSSDSCLRITLDDILNVQTKGRWWKVGASWIGNQTLQDGADQGEAGTKGGKPRDDEEEELLALASKFRMNTDSRRSIFCIIMGSADCEDAFEKLVRGGMLKNRTERDTVRVLMECCGNEKAYNPFYAHLGARMCEYMPQCKFTFQLAYWDSFKQFNTMKQRKVANLAKLLYQLVAVNPCLKINILKSIDMAPDTIEENAVIFLTIFFSSIFGSVEDPNQVFQLIERGIPKTDEGGLRESLSVFFLETLKSSPKNKKKSKFRANFKAAVKACEVDEFDGMIPA